MTFVTVPDVVGSSNPVPTLKAAGLSFTGERQPAASNPGASGTGSQSRTVTATTPPAGAIIPKGSTVALHYETQ